MLSPVTYPQFEAYPLFIYIYFLRRWQTMTMAHRWTIGFVFIFPHRPWGWGCFLQFLWSYIICLYTFLHNTSILSSNPQRIKHLLCGSLRKSSGVFRTLPSPPVWDPVGKHRSRLLITQILSKIFHAYTFWKPCSLIPYDY